MQRTHSLRARDTEPSVAVFLPDEADEGAPSRLEMGCEDRVPPTSAESSRPQVGNVIGARYRILSSLGVGGMGEVFEAENLFTRKHVALKWLNQTLSSDPISAQRLIREAQAVGRIRHPNVVDIYDIGREGDAMFLVMELLVGETLEERLTRGRLPLHILLELILPAMRGVAAGHRQGVIHRDLKPENIFLAHVEDQLKPVPKVLDFGISKLLGDEELSLTLPGFAVGTPLYMSIEQIRGDIDVDERADIYAFAVILYEALTGQLPFTDESLLELARKIGSEVPLAVDHFRDDLPASLPRLIARAMAKDREQRPHSLDEFIRELEALGSKRVQEYAAKIARAVESVDVKPASTMSALGDGPFRRWAWLSLCGVLVMTAILAWSPLQQLLRASMAFKSEPVRSESDASNAQASALNPGTTHLRYVPDVALNFPKRVSVGRQAPAAIADGTKTSAKSKPVRIKPSTAVTGTASPSDGSASTRGKTVGTSGETAAPTDTPPEGAQPLTPREPLPSGLPRAAPRATPSSAEERREQLVVPGDSLLVPSEG